MCIAFASDVNVRLPAGHAAVCHQCSHSCDAAFISYDVSAHAFRGSVMPLAGGSDAQQEQSSSRGSIRGGGRVDGQAGLG